MLAAEAAVNRVNPNDTGAQQRAKGFSAVDFRVSQRRFAGRAYLCQQVSGSNMCCICSVPACSFTRCGGWVRVRGKSGRDVGFAERTAIITKEQKVRTPEQLAFAGTNPPDGSFNKTALGRLVLLPSNLLGRVVCEDQSVVELP